MAKKTQAGLSAVLPKEETIDPTHVSIDERIDRIIEKGVAAGKSLLVWLDTPGGDTQKVSVSAYLPDAREEIRQRLISARA